MGLLEKDPLTYNRGLLAQGDRYRNKPAFQMKEVTPQGLLDTAALATSPVPILGDVLGLGADAYRFATDPESRNAPNYALAALGLLPFVPAAGAAAGLWRGSAGPSMGGNQVGAVGPVKLGMDWPTASKKGISYKEYKKQASDSILNEANSLAEMLRKQGIEPSSSGLGQIGEFKPHVYENQIGGLSSYMQVPGFGEVRFSDHSRSSGLGASHSFPTAQDAYEAVMAKRAATQSAKNELSELRKSLGIQDDGENMKRIQKFLSENPQSGQMKDPGYWKHKLRLGVGWYPD